MTLTDPAVLIAAIAGALIILVAACMWIARGFTRQLASEDFYRSLIENASDLMLVMDRQAVRRFVSPSYERILGYKPEELVGGVAWDCVHPEDLPHLQATIAALAARPGDLERVTFRVRHADGSDRVLTAIFKNLLEDTTVRGFVVTAQDETERKQLELQVQHAQKMDAVGKLAGGIAHDFNNLLTVIIGNLQVLSEEVRTQPAAAEVIGEVQAAAERAAGLTRQLLAFSRRQVLQPQVLQLNEVVGAIHKMIARLLGANIDFQLDLAEQLPPVRVDAGQVEQAIVNLAVNARDAMPDGGRLTIETSYVTSLPADVLPAGHAPAPAYVCLQVSDTGTGIEQHIVDRIFEPFFTTKEVGHGTGLGLATVYGIMNQSEGYVSVETKSGEGSRFRLLFPAQLADEPTLQAVVAPRHAVGNGTVTSGTTILLIEDEPAVRSFAQRVLERAGYQVLATQSGLEAVNAARLHQGAIQLVLSDVVLPDINGREAFERISLMRHGARILYMSGYTEDEAILRGALSSDVRFLQKPFSPQELLAKVRATLD